MPADLLAGASWECRPPDEAGWLAASVPGTAAGALRSAGRWAVPDGRDFDAETWEFRCRFPGAPGRWALELDGLATLAEVRLNGELVLTSTSMFQPHRVEVAELAGDNVLELRFLPLLPVVTARHPRARWRTRLVPHQHLRWYRTTFLGRMPGWAPIAAPVGPWRAVRLTDAPPRPVLRAWCDGDDGVVEVTGPGERVEVAGVTAPFVAGRAEVRVPGADRWWPHTHGSPTRHDVQVDGALVGRVGFRTVAADRSSADGSDGDFRVLVNGVPVFCRGGGWVPPDVVSLHAPDETRRTLALARDAGLNMVRILGTMTWEDDAFWDACDELGILVWHDLPFANVDPPDDPEWLAQVEAEVTAQLGAVGARPSLAVVCGGSEVEQQAAMVGLPAAKRTMPLFDTHLPKLLDRLGIDVPYVPSSPTGDGLPFRPGTGIAHYYGVGAYLRPVEDARRADVRFAAESLAFAVPPERPSVEAMFGSAALAGHHPRWKWAVPRDEGSSWDFEDVRDHYVRELFGVDASDVRRDDPERYLDLGRAAVVELVEAVFAEWRRPASRCGGGLTLLLRDLWPGAGWGFLDSAGAPKAPWWAMRRVSRPLAVFTTDEGLNGLRVHVVNDGEHDVAADLRIDVFDDEGRVREDASTPLVVPARDGVALDAEVVLDGFRDLTHAYRFGPRAYDAVAVTFADAHAVHLVGGAARPIVPDVGLHAELDHDAGGWFVDVTSQTLAQRVVVEAPGHVADDSWFHLVPGRTARVRLSGDGDPSGEVRALNSRAPARFG
jgi:beta-mannosidase